jgi:NitT/TauT family transport system substrate-binding protein
MVPLAIFLLFATSAEARRVRLAFPTPGPLQLAFYSAQSQGYYKEEGLDVEFILMPATTANLALIGGNVDATTIGVAGLNAALRGAPIKNIFNSFDRPAFWIYGKAGIRDVKDLAGKRVATPGGLAAATGILLREITRRHGLEAGRDVAVITVAASATGLKALQSGSVDAAVLVLPDNFEAAAAGFVEVVSFIKADVPTLNGSIVVRDQLLESEPAAAERLLRATIKGLIYAREQRAGAAAILAKNLKVKEDFAVKIYDVSRAAMTTDGLIPAEWQKKNVELVMNSVGLKEGPAAEKLFDFSLARKINAELARQGWRPAP